MLLFVVVVHCEKGSEVKVVITSVTVLIPITVVV